MNLHDQLWVGCLVRLFACRQNPLSIRWGEIIFVLLLRPFELRNSALYRENELLNYFKIIVFIVPFSGKTRKIFSSIRRLSTGYSPDVEED